MRTRASGASGSIRRHVLAAMTIGLLVVGGVGGWAVTTELAGAVVASGSLVVDSNVKKVQHPTGGGVGELRVGDGGRGSAGGVVIRLDETIMRANGAIGGKGIDELTAPQSRRETERDDESELQFPKELTSRMDNPDVRRVVNGERQLFDLRRSARAGQKAQLKERIGQLKEEILGLTEQAEAKKSEIDWITTELEGV